ncbi:hypothetical protein Btru_055272 [Bulinus truncatus]|nr:hypothetical protein Btru_055272 [Bulinus truncatus]
MGLLSNCVKNFLIASLRCTTTDLCTKIFFATCAVRCGYYPTHENDCGLVVDIFGAISFLLNVRGLSNLQNWNSVMARSACAEDEWTSPEHRCLELKCAPGHVIHTGKCSGVTDQPAGRGFSLRLRFRLNHVHGGILKMSSVTSVLDSLTLQVIQSFGKMLAVLQEYSQDIFLLIVADDNVAPYKSQIFRLECRFLAKRNVSMKDIHLIENLINRNVSVETDQYAVLYFKIFNVLNSFAVDRTVFDHVMNESCDRTLNPIFQPLDRNFIEFVNNYFVKYQQFRYQGHAFQIFVQRSDCNKTKELEKSDDFDRVDKFSKISGVLICPYVSLRLSNYEMTFNETVLPPDVTITITLGPVKISITDKEDFKWIEIDENNTLNVCRGLLDSKLKDIVYRLQNDTYVIPFLVYVVTTVCFAVSMACLLLTLLTYFLFPVLRTDAGINNMFLSGSLLLAQVSVLVSSHIDRMNAACTAVGIATHWLWLWMFTWSFICSHRMFQVFTGISNTRCDATNATNRAWKKTVASLLPPTMVTLCVVLVNYMTSGGSSIGYGSSLCYLDSGRPIVIFVVVPLILITCSNLTFFLITVYKIYQTRRLQSSSTNVINENNKYLFIYAKLSTLTGVFWTVAVVAEALDNEVLQYISIILNGLQGVAIFISFTCNKRVLVLVYSLRQTRHETNDATR